MTVENNFFNQQELLRYSRHLSLDTIGLEGQEKLKRARILCVGAGGLGAPVLQYLAAVGVGHIGIIDDDSVELSNLQRQVLFTQEDVAASKIEVARIRLAAQNPHITISIHKERLSEQNALEIIGQYQIIVDGTDNFASRYLINDACFHLHKPNVYASVLKFTGQISVFTAKNGPCYRCLFASPPALDFAPNCAEGGVLGVLPGIMGTLQALEVIKLICAVGDPLIGRLLTFDGLAMNFQEFSLPKNPECVLCSYGQSFANISRPSSACTLDNAIEQLTAEALHKLIKDNADIFLLDVREPYEYQICHLGGHLIPLNELPARMDEVDSQKKVVVYCQSGVRSLQAANLLVQAGFACVANLQGGIIAWMEKQKDKAEE